jgi:hypothetical protein
MGVLRGEGDELLVDVVAGRRPEEAEVDVLAERREVRDVLFTSSTSSSMIRIDAITWIVSDR